MRWLLRDACPLPPYLQESQRLAEPYVYEIHHLRVGVRKRLPEYARHSDEYRNLNLVRMPVRCRKAMAVPSTETSTSLSEIVDEAHDD